MSSWKDDSLFETRGWSEVLVTEPTHPFIANWWPPGHIIGWEDTFVHEIAHLLGAIANHHDIAPQGATFDDGYRNVVICDSILQSTSEGRILRVGAG